jgi:hypothetical protein
MGKWSRFFDKAYGLILLVSILAALAATAYIFLYAKDYYFIVEAPCDVSTQICYIRDCEGEPDSCPPNGLSSYSRSLIRAVDFKRCSDNSCANECSVGTIACDYIQCDPSVDSCSDTIIQ